MAIKNKKLGKYDPLTIKHICDQIDHFAQMGFPIDAVREVCSWETIFKSKSSLSFYNKVKTWLRTEEGTLRMSDHWNFIAKNSKEGKGKIENWDPNYIHSKTDIPIEKQWAVGSYNRETKVYKILKTYAASENNRDELIQLREELKLKINEERAKNPFPQDIIEKRKLFKAETKIGSILFKSSNIIGHIIKFDKRKIDGYSRRYFIVKNESSEKEVFIDIDKDFTIVLNNSEYNLIDLQNENFI